MPDSVAMKVQHLVARIFSIPDPVFHGILDQHRLRLIKQRANQLNISAARRRTPPLHPDQPFPAAAAKQPQEEQLKLIVRVMRQRDARNSQSPGGASQKLMAQLSRGHFQGQFPGAGKLAHLRLPNHQRHLQLLGRAANQPLIRGAAPATKLMIQMRCRHPPAVSGRHFVQQVQQDHRIRPAGNRHQDPLPRAKQPPGLDALVNVVE
jgi:hypothetical protein